MITKDQQLAANNAAENNVVQVCFAHIWPSPADCVALNRQPVAFYHVVSGDYAVGSTVTIHSLLALGLRVEVVEAK